MTFPIVYKGEPERVCTFCNSDISHKRAGAIYCSDSCKLKANRAKKPKPKRKRKPKMTPLQNLAASTFGTYIANYCRRVSTVQIFPQSITVEDLAELWDMMKFKIEANGVGEHRLPFQKGYDLCHLSPAIGKDGSTGYLIPANLVVAPASLNRSIGNASTIYSDVKHLSLPPTTKLWDRKWRVAPEVTQTNEQILRRLNRYLGGTLAAYQDQYNHKPTANTTGSLHPLAPASVMEASLAHIQKHHSKLFNPVAVMGSLGITAIAPKGMESTLPDVTIEDSWRYLLTGNDSAWKAVEDEPYEMRYVDLGNYDDWTKPMGGWVRYPKAA